MMKTFVLLALLLQNSVAPIRIGELAKKLSPQEVKELESLAAAGGNSVAPWLLESPVGSDSRSLRLYLAPKTQTLEFRRGPAIEVIRRQGQSLWIPTKTVEYAQMLKAGQAGDSIKGEQRPFVISGKITDDDLVGLVSFIRRSEGSARLISLENRADGSVTALLQASAEKVRMIVLQRKGSSWKVLQSQVGIP